MMARTVSWEVAWSTGGMWRIDTTPGFENARQEMLAKCWEYIQCCIFCSTLQTRPAFDCCLLFTNFTFSSLPLFLDSAALIPLAKTIHADSSGFRSLCMWELRICSYYTSSNSATTYIIIIFIVITIIILIIIRLFSPKAGIKVAWYTIPCSHQFFPARYESAPRCLYMQRRSIGVQRGPSAPGNTSPFFGDGQPFSWRWLGGATYWGAPGAAKTLAM